MLYRRSPGKDKVGKVQGSPTDAYGATAKSVAFISPSVRPSLPTIPGSDARSKAGKASVKR